VWKSNLKHGEGTLLSEDGVLRSVTFDNDRMAGDPVTMGTGDIQLENVITQNISILKDIYLYYSNLGKSREDDTSYLNYFQLLQLFKDCRIQSENVVRGKFSPKFLID
jgi:hypothetical protein